MCNILSAMTENINLIHERVDDIPLLIGVAQRLSLPEVLDRHLGTHGHHQGLSNGWLATVWLAYILSEGDHRKSSVEDWVQQHLNTLQRLVEQPIRPGEFNDDRLGIVLHRLSSTAAWNGLETDLWQSTVAVYEMEITGVHLDSTTAKGYHTPTADGTMQYGYSKDHRPDLPQLKLMAAAADPSGHLLACDTHPGQSADDPLYIPLLERVRPMVDRRGLLYMGDSKMAAKEIRSSIVAHEDYYLFPLPRTGETHQQIEQWISAIVDGEQTATLIWEGDQLLGGGYEFERVVCAEVGDKQLRWTERVGVVRSHDLALQQTRQLETRLAQAKEMLEKLTPQPSRGKRQYRDEEDLQTAICLITEQHQLQDLLSVEFEREEKCITRYVGRGRGGPHRKKRKEVQVRYQITDVKRNEAAIAQKRHRFGFRIQATNLPSQQVSLSQAVVSLRGAWSIERDFHLLKSRPLGISPLYVRKDDQILGITRLLTLALRLLTLIETQVRHALAADGESLLGLYLGQPNQATNRPTARRLLKAIARQQSTLTRIEIDGKIRWHITLPTDLLKRTLLYLRLPVCLYNRLVEDSS